MVEPTCERFKLWDQNNKPIQKVGCNNAGENVALENRCKSTDWQINIEIEYKSRDTPQHKSLVEVGFATLTD